MTSTGYHVEMLGTAVFAVTGVLVVLTAIGGGLPAG